MKNSLSLQVCAGPDPDFGSLQLPPLYLVSQALMLKCSLVPKVLGRQAPAFKHCCRACLEAQGMKAPQGFRHF